MDKKLKLVSLSEVELQEVEWLWYPYIPFGKITIIQGDPGEGKQFCRVKMGCTKGTAHSMVVFVTNHEYMRRSSIYG